MRFALAAGAIIAVVLIAGAAALFMIPDRKLTNEIYARVCVDITRLQLLQPSSMDIRDAVVGQPSDLDPSVAIAGIDPSVKKLKATYATLVEQIQADYKNQRPHREVHAFIQYSGRLKRPGIVPVGLSECTFREVPGTSDYESRLVDIILDGRRITPNDTLAWMTTAQADNLSALQEVEIGLRDRIRYLTGSRTVTN
ncbi:hypothetical protein [Inquilinus sp.]|uniref:hypothetical protein n=1 Tax=Inquilinus sp. TaxID=1932117 RepID=UPI0031E47F76